MTDFISWVDSKSVTFFILLAVFILFRFISFLFKQSSQAKDMEEIEKLAYSIQFLEEDNEDKKNASNHIQKIDQIKSNFEDLNRFVENAEESIKGMQGEIKNLEIQREELLREKEKIKSLLRVDKNSLDILIKKIQKKEKEWKNRSGTFIIGFAASFISGVLVTFLF